MSDTQFYLSIQERNIPLTYHTQLTQADIPQLQPQGYDGVVAQINPNPNNTALLGLKNCSTQIWTVNLPTGEIRQIQRGQTIKLEENTQIDFGSVYGTIVSHAFAYQPVNNTFYTVTSDELLSESSSPWKYIGKKIVAILGLIILLLSAFLGSHNFDLLNIILYLASGFLCSLALWQPKLARYYDVLFAQVSPIIFLWSDYDLIIALLTALLVFQTISLRQKYNKTKYISLTTIIIWSMIFVLGGWLLPALFSIRTSMFALIIMAIFYRIESNRLENLTNGGKPYIIKETVTTIGIANYFLFSFIIGSLHPSPSGFLFADSLLDFLASLLYLAGFLLCFLPIYNPKKGRYYDMVFAQCAPILWPIFFYHMMNGDDKGNSIALPLAIITSLTLFSVVSTIRLRLKKTDPQSLSLIIVISGLTLFFIGLFLPFFVWMVAIVSIDNYLLNLSVLLTPLIIIAIFYQIEAMNLRKSQAISS
jgi:hypothetical protein